MKTHGPEKKILIGCTIPVGLLRLENLPDDIQRLNDDLTILPLTINDILVSETVQYLIDDELMLYSMNNFYTNDNILLHIVNTNITRCWIVSKNKDIVELEIIMMALRINQHLLPRVIFTGFNIITKIYQIFLIAHALCDDEEFIIIFGTVHFIDRTTDNSMRAMIKQFPEMVEYGQHQFHILQNLGQTIWQD
jgi:hypothetical protein